MPDERSAPRTYWGQVPKNSYRPIFEFWLLKVENLRFMYYGSRTMLGINFSPIGEGHLFCLLISLFSGRDLQTHFVLISLLVLYAAPYNLTQKWTSLRPINPMKSAPVCCKLMELLEYLRFPAQNPIGCHVKLRNHLQKDALHPSPMSALYVCRH